jgi:hypothetical protein
MGLQNAREPGAPFRFDRTGRTSGQVLRESLAPGRVQFAIPVGAQIEFHLVAVHRRPPSLSS